MLTFNVVLGYQGLLSTSCDFFLSFFFFFQSDRPTDPISGNAFDAKRKKKGMGLHRIQVIIIRHEDSRREGLVDILITIRASTPVNNVNLKLKFTPIWKTG